MRALRDTKWTGWSTFLFLLITSSSLSLSFSFAWHVIVLLHGRWGGIE
jgi:hypothetical protein